MHCKRFLHDLEAAEHEELPEGEGSEKMQCARQAGRVAFQYALGRLTKALMALKMNLQNATKSLRHGRKLAELKSERLHAVVTCDIHTIQLHMSAACERIALLESHGLRHYPMTVRQLNEVADRFQTFPCLTSAQLLKEVNMEISPAERVQAQVATAMEYAKQLPLMLPLILVDLSYGQRSIHKAKHLIFISLDHPNSAHVLAKMLYSCSNRYNAVEAHEDNKDEDESVEKEDVHHQDGEVVPQQGAGRPRFESQSGLVDFILSYVNSRGQLRVQAACCVYMMYEHNVNTRSIFSVIKQNVRTTCEFETRSKPLAHH